MSLPPATPTPACPNCRQTDPVRRLTDPTIEASHRCGRCGRSFTHGRVDR